MVKRILLAALILCVAAAGSAFANGGKEDTGAKKYACVLGKVPSILESPYHQAVIAVGREYAEKMYNAKYIAIDGQADNEKTLAAVETLIRQKVDAIALHTGDPGLMTTAIKLAHKAGIPIVTTLIRPTEKLAPHIQPLEAPSSQTMGEVAAGQWLAAHPGTHCHVAMLDFGGFEQIEEMRTGPFLKGVKAVDPGAVLVAQLNGYGSSVKSMEVTLDILQGNPNVNIIFGANDEMGLGALAACEQLGRGRMDNGKPLTEVIAGLGGSVAAMVEICNPNSSFKLTHGAVRDNALKEVDTMIAMIRKQIPMDQYQEQKVLSVEMDYWNTPIAEAQRFLEDNYLYKGRLADDAARKAASKK
jgi:ABC-type sugar transport system substrate-binding protein